MKIYAHLFLLSQRYWRVKTWKKIIGKNGSERKLSKNPSFRRTHQESHILFTRQGRLGYQKVALVHFQVSSTI